MSGSALMAPDSWRQRVQAAAALILGALVVLSFRYERYQPIVAAGAALALAILTKGVPGSTGWWSTRRTLVIAITVDVTLIFLYLWTLDERVHVVIRATPAGYVASVDGATATLQRPMRTGYIGFYAANGGGYHTKATGDAYIPNPTSVLERFVEWARFAAPRPAWTSIQLTLPGQSTRNVPLASLVGEPPGSWTVNRRGELEGDLGSFIVLNVTPGSRFTLYADLARPDGLQGILVGLDRSGSRGYMFAPRLDQPDALWSDWSGSPVGDFAGGTPLNLGTMAMVQRDLRLLLGNVMAALILALLVIPVYALLAFLLHFLPHRLPMLRFHFRGHFPHALDDAALLLAAAAFIPAYLFGDRILDHIPHVQDSVMYLFQAKTLALGRLWAPAPPLGDFFKTEFALMGNGRWFGKYPPGWPLLLALGVKAGVTWIVTPVLTAADVFLVYLIDREVYGRCVGLLAALFAACSPFLQFLGGDVMSHTCTLFYMGVGVYCYLRWVKRAEWRLLPVAGFFLGMALITRELDTVVYALPFAALLPFRSPVRALRAAGAIAAGAAPPVLFFLFYNWELTGSALKTPFNLYDATDRLGFGTGTGYGGNFTPADGLWNTSRNLQMLLTHLFGWPFYLTLALAALPFVLGRASRWDAVFAASALCVIVAYVAYFTPAALYGPRYYFLTILSFSLLSARGAEELFRWMLSAPGLAVRSRAAAALVTAGVISLLLACNLFVYTPANVPLYRDYNTAGPEPLDAVTRAGVHHAVVFVNVTTGPWSTYLVPFSRNSPLLNNDVVYARDLGPLDGELMRLYPGRSFYRLDGTSVTPMRP